MPAPLTQTRGPCERGKTHGTRPAVAYHQRIFDVASERQLQLRQTPRYGKRRAAQHRKPQPPRGVDHCLGLFEAVGKMLVVVNRNGAPVPFENLGTLLEEFVSRIQDLALI